MSIRQCDHVIKLTSYQDLSTRPKVQNRLRDRLSTMSPSGLLHFASRSIETQRNDEMWRSDVLLTIFCVLFSWLLVSPAFGQEADGFNKVQPLRVGDKVPKDFWTREHVFFVDGDTVRRTLEEFRKTPLILDFWATWCGTCIQKFKSNAGYQKELNNEVRFVLVNSDLKKDDLGRIRHVLTDTSHFGGNSGQSIIFDSYIKQLFPHQAIPHYVWIDHTDRVRAISTFDFVTKEQMVILMNRKRGIW